MADAIGQLDVQLVLIKQSNSICRVFSFGHGGFIPEVRTNLVERGPLFVAHELLSFISSLGWTSQGVEKTSAAPQG